MDDRNMDKELLEEKIRLLGSKVPAAKNKDSFKAEFLEMVEEEKWARNTVSVDQSIQIMDIFRFRIGKLAAGMTAMATLLGGAAYASQGTLPNNPLYKVKRTIESAKLSLPLSDEALAKATLDQLKERLNELSRIDASSRDKQFLVKEINSTVTKLEHVYKKLPKNAQEAIAKEINKVIDKNADEIKKIKDSIKPDNKEFIDEVQAPEGRTGQNEQTPVAVIVEPPVIVIPIQDTMPQPPDLGSVNMPSYKYKANGLGFIKNQTTEIEKPEGAIKAQIKALIKRQQRDLKLIARILLPASVSISVISNVQETTGSVQQPAIIKPAKNESGSEAVRSKAKNDGDADDKVSEQDIDESETPKTVEPARESDQRPETRPAKPAKREKEQKSAPRSLFRALDKQYSAEDGGKTETQTNEHKDF